MPWDKLTGSIRSLCSAALFCCNMGSLLFSRFKRRCCWFNPCGRREVWKFEISCNVILSWRLGVSIRQSATGRCTSLAQEFQAEFPYNVDHQQGWSQATSRAHRALPCREGVATRNQRRVSWLSKVCPFGPSIVIEEMWCLRLKSIFWVLHYSTIWISGL